MQTNWLNINIEEYFSIAIKTWCDAKIIELKLASIQVNTNLAEKDRTITITYIELRNAMKTHIIFKSNSQFSKCEKSIDEINWQLFEKIVRLWKKRKRNLNFNTEIKFKTENIDFDLIN